MKKLEQVAETEEAVPQVDPTQPEDWQAEAPQAVAPVINNKSITNVIEVERGGVAWCDIYGMSHDADNQVHLVKISLTNRDDNAEAALRGLMQALMVAKTEFRMTPYQPSAPLVPAVPKSMQQPVNTPATAAPAAPVAPQVPAAPVAPAQPVYTPYPPAAPAPAPAAGLPANPNTATSGVMDVVKINVTPREDGKVKVDLFGLNRKYADLSMIGTPAQMAEKLASKGFTPAHFAGAATYPVNLKATWANSERTNANGVPYKNVTAIA